MTNLEGGPVAIHRFARALAPVLLAFGCADGPSRPSGASDVDARGFAEGRE